jgi:hypothetical protein
MAAEGMCRKVHENVTVTRDPADGMLQIEWLDGDPRPGDQVLMSVELFQQMIEEHNARRASRL